MHTGEARTTIDTKAVRGRRALRFHSIDEALAEVDRIVDAGREERLTTLGNWSPGQALGHVGAWASYPYEGFPLPRAPWFVRALVGVRKRRYLERGLPAGVRIPGVEGGTYGVETLPIEEGAARMRAAFRRLAGGQAPRHPSPVFGPLSLDEWRALNLRHAELHLGFLRY